MLQQCDDHLNTYRPFYHQSCHWHIEICGIKSCLLTDNENDWWMSINCAKTCGKCGENNIDPTGETKGTGETVQQDKNWTNKVKKSHNIVITNQCKRIVIVVARSLQIPR